MEWGAFNLTCYNYVQTSLTTFCPSASIVGDLKFVNIFYLNTVKSLVTLLPDLNSKETMLVKRS